MWLLFDDPLVEGLYEPECPTSARFRCSAAVRKHFTNVLNFLRCMESSEEIRSCQSFDCQPLDARHPRFSVKITAGYRLDFSCHEQEGQLVGLTVHALCLTHTLSSSLR